MVVPTDHSVQRRGLGVAAWMLAVTALILSLSGWFTLFGLAIAAPTMIFSRAVRFRGPFITAAAAACVSVVWALIDFFVS